MEQSVFNFDVNTIILYCYAKKNNKKMRGIMPFRLTSDIFAY